MSVIPEKYTCDAEGCTVEAVTFGEAAARGWFIVTFSDKPKYCAVNPWKSIGSVPAPLSKYHACKWDHARALLDILSLNL